MPISSPPLYTLERLTKKSFALIEGSGFVFQEHERSALEKGRIFLVSRLEGQKFPLLAIQSTRKKVRFLEPFALLYEGSDRAKPSWERLLLGKVDAKGLLPFAQAAQNTHLEAMLSRQSFLWTFDVPSRAYKEFLLDGPPPRLVSFASIYENRPYFHLPIAFFLAICGTFPPLLMTAEELEDLPPFLANASQRIHRLGGGSYSKYDLMPPPPQGQFACYLVAQVDQGQSVQVGTQHAHPCRWFRPVLPGYPSEGFFYVRRHVTGSWTSIPIPPMPSTFFADTPEADEETEGFSSAREPSKSETEETILDAEFFPLTRQES